MLKAADAELKIVIAGNPDLTLDRDYCKVFTHKADLQKRKPKKFEKAKELWTGKEATQAGIIYLAERVRTFELKNGANYTINQLAGVYTSPYQPEFYNWGFAYERNEDRFNTAQLDSQFIAPNPVPSWPGINIMLTHGPPRDILIMQSMEGT
ncbi:hypothetical protein MMC06_000929 [Schaereria dolodes]|nr:hypothetical protein [Schaereria dolodes]